MLKRPWFGLSLVLSVLLAAVQSGSHAADVAKPAKPAPAKPAKSVDLKIGVVSSMFRDIPPKGIDIVLKNFTDLVQLQTGYSVQITIAGDALELAEAMKKGTYQMAVFNGFEYAWAREKAPELQPLMIAVNRQRELQAHLLVRNDPAVCKIKDLQGKVLAQPWRCKEFARLFLERRCLESKRMMPAELFKSIEETPSSEEAIDKVVEGEADAAILDGVSVNAYATSKPKEFAKLKDLCVSEQFPASVLAYCKDGLPKAQLANFQKGMLDANQSKEGRGLMKWCGMTSFETIPDNYEELLCNILKAYPAECPQAEQQEVKNK